MWLVVEEVRAHQLVMAWVVLFGVVVSEVGASGGTVNTEVDLTGTVPDTVEAHTNCFDRFCLTMSLENPTAVVLFT